LRQLSELGSLIPEALGRRLFAEAACRRLGFDEATLAREIEILARRERGGGSWRARAAASPGGRGPGGSGPAEEARGRGSARLGAGGRLESGAERMLLALALGNPTILRQVRQELSVEDFVDPVHRQLIESLLDREERGESIRAADLVGPDAEEPIARLVTSLAVEPAATEELEGALPDLIASIQARRRRAEIQRLRELIREHEAAGRRDEIAPLLEQVQSLIRAD
jgi:hypothetical protein